MFTLHVYLTIIVTYFVSIITIYLYIYKELINYLNKPSKIFQTNIRFCFCLDNIFDSYMNIFFGLTSDHQSFAVNFKLKYVTLGANRDIHLICGDGNRTRDVLISSRQP